MSDIICDHCGADQDMSEWVNQRTKNEKNCIVVCPECHQDTGTVLDVVVDYEGINDTYQHTPTGIARVIMSDITAKDLVARHKALERDITAAVDKLTADFHKETGIVVSDIDISSIDVTTMGSDDKIYIRSTKVSVEL